MAVDLATFQTAVERDLLRLAPPDTPPEFPQVTTPPELYVEGASVIWHEVNETRGAHAAGARDGYEQDAVERIWKDWERWRSERLSEWASLVEPANWAAADLELWAAWWRRLPGAEQARWQRRLDADQEWWRAVEQQERDWWARRDREQEHWLTSLIESARERRPKGFLGRLAPPDDAWRDWLDAETEARQRELDRTWADHRMWAASKIRTEALRTVWLQAVGNDALAQLRGLKPVVGATDEYRYWEARLSGPGAGLTWPDWQAFQNYWAATALSVGQRLASTPGVKERLCPALTSVTGDVWELGKVIAPALVGMVAAGTLGVSVVPAVAAGVTLVVARAGVAAWCGTEPDGARL